MHREQLYSVGDVTLQIVYPSLNLFVGADGQSQDPDWTSIRPGNEIALSGPENINAIFQNFVYSAGFEIVEPSVPGFTPGTNSCNYSVCSDTTFSVTTLNNTTPIDTVYFNVQDDTLAFLGLWSDSPFDRIHIRDLTDTVDNEYFGEFYSGTNSPTPVPIIPSIFLMSTGLFLLFSAARNKQHSDLLTTT